MIRDDADQPWSDARVDARRDADETGDLVRAFAAERLFRAGLGDYALRHVDWAWVEGEPQGGNRRVPVKDSRTSTPCTWIAGWGVVIAAVKHSGENVPGMAAPVAAWIAGVPLRARRRRPHSPEVPYH